MKRTAFDERRDVQIANDTQTTTVLPCTFCNTLTPVNDLNTYGARCFSCYRDYCDQGRHYPSLTREQRREMAERVKQALAGGLRPAPREYIRGLEEKEAAGTLTAGQRGFLAAVRSSAKAPSGE